MPNDDIDKDVAKLNKKKKSKNIQSAKKQIQKSKQKTVHKSAADDDISVLKDNNGEPILSNEEFRRLQTF